MAGHPDRLVASFGVAGVAAGAGASGGMTTRRGGASVGRFDSLNLGDAVGDAPDAVAANRRALGEAIGVPAVILRQMHGTRVVRLTAADARPGAARHEADAAVTTEPGLACAVLVADCLPVLFAAPCGRAVGAAHAGWRGLAAGVLEATLAAVCDAAACRPEEVSAWLGACIGPRAFEVGADVLAGFGVAPHAPSDRFVPGRPGRWFADLGGLARDRLRAAGAVAVDGVATCTFSEPSRFFSYRRDGVTGRMAATVCLVR